MGQYYKIVNLDKQQYIDTYCFNEGAKLLEFGCSSDGVLTALAVLLADGNGRGGGDLHSEHPIIGSWSGDRIVVAGDYADENKFLQKQQIVKYKLLNQGLSPNLYNYAMDHFEDISEQALAAILDDSFIYDIYAKADLYGPAADVFYKVQKAKKKQRKKQQATNKIAKAG
jgi:hypothetical protein